MDTASKTVTVMSWSTHDCELNIPKTVNFNCQLLSISSKQVMDKNILLVCFAMIALSECFRTSFLTHKLTFTFISKKIEKKPETEIVYN